MKWLGKITLGLSYGLSCFLAIIKSLSLSVGSKHGDKHGDPSKNRLGSFLVQFEILNFNTNFFMKKYLID